MIFIDANIPIYAGGREHPLREPSRDVLRLAAAYPDSFVTSAEVLQEMLHRYVAIRAGARGREQVSDFAELMRGSVEPFLLQDVERAIELAAVLTNVEARDLAHIAVMQRLGVTRIVSADRGFDRAPDIERLDPARFHEWRSEVTGDNP